MTNGTALLPTCSSKTSNRRSAAIRGAALSRRPVPSVERGINPMIKGLHHSAFRCRDSEETRAFYEDFLGLPLANTLHIEHTKTGRETDVLHTFYRMADGSCLAFFEVPGVS